jgi:hypothetical protein
MHTVQAVGQVGHTKSRKVLSNIAILDLLIETIRNSVFTPVGVLFCIVASSVFTDANQPKIGPSTEDQVRKSGFP